ncbi:uncharacterized protein LOC144437282 [Glandiceps talaboti]
MSANCYPSKAEKGGGLEEQHDRLTSRHIETLGFLQEIVRENKQLKVKVEELEVELEAREELYQLAKNSQSRIGLFQEECLKRIDRAQDGLRRKHNEEMMKLVADKLESENEWLREKEQMQKQLTTQEKHNAILVDQVEKLRKHNMEIDTLNKKLDQTLKEVEELRLENERLQTENVGYKADAEKLHSYESKSEILAMELKDANQKNKELKFKISKLEKELSASLSAGEDTCSDKEKLKKRLLQMNKESEQYSKRGAEQQMQLSTLQSRLLEKDAQLRVEQEERERLLILVDTLNDELNRTRQQLEQQQHHHQHQQHHHQHHPPIVEKQSFKEYVRMKRELVSLREENETLKVGKLKQHNSLPRLTMESPETRDKLRSKNGSADSKERSRTFSKTHASISFSNFGALNKK